MFSAKLYLHTVSLKFISILEPFSGGSFLFKTDCHFCKHSLPVNYICFNNRKDIGYLMGDVMQGYDLLTGVN